MTTSAFFHGYVPVLAVGAVICPLGLHAAARGARPGLMTASLAALLALLLWRQGQYLATEFALLGANIKERGRRTDDFLRALLAARGQRIPSYDGEFFKFSDMIVDRRNMRREIADLLALLQKQPADALA